MELESALTKRKPDTGVEELEQQVKDENDDGKESEEEQGDEDDKRALDDN
jgi:hypothetical protein